ncbi:MAG TPA: DinB family protein [Candidatus Nitrosotenuis sp.]|nr:DinB family protein [Candidatus Nitrosotenuis sp.]
MNLERIRELYDFNAWANRRVLDSCTLLSAEQFTRPLGSSFSSVRDTLAHILGAEWIWLERWQGRSPKALPSAAEFFDLSTVRARWLEVEQKQLAFVRALGVSDLERECAYINLQGQPFAYPMRSCLQHVVNHGSYHRGQAATLLRQLGANPRPTDFLLYLDVIAGNAAE